MPYALVIQKWLIKFWKFYIHNICRSFIQLVQKKYIEMEYRFFIKQLLEKNVKNRIFANKKSVLLIDAGRCRI